MYFILHLILCYLTLFVSFTFITYLCFQSLFLDLTIAHKFVRGCIGIKQNVDLGLEVCVDGERFLDHDST